MCFNSQLKGAQDILLLYRMTMRKNIPCYWSTDMA